MVSGITTFHELGQEENARLDSTEQTTSHGRPTPGPPSWASHRGLLAFVATTFLCVSSFALISTSKDATAPEAGPTGAGWGSTVQLFQDAELHDAVLETMTALGNMSMRQPGARDRLRAMIDVGFNHVSAAAASRKADGPTVTVGQRGRLLRLVRQLRDLQLQRVPRPGVKPRGLQELDTYEYRSTDEKTNDIGTGDLGSMGSEDVSDVILHVNTSDESMDFVVGPPVDNGMYVIAGKMNVLDHGPGGRLSGSINAGFVNLHSTLMGTWETDRDGLDGTVYIHLSDMIEEEWRWDPIPQELQKQYV